jgi:hypothetical protein
MHLNQFWTKLYELLEFWNCGLVDCVVVQFKSEIFGWIPTPSLFRVEMCMGAAVFFKN